MKQTGVVVGAKEPRNLDALLMMVDDASRIRKEDEEIDRQLNLSKAKAELKEKIMGVAREAKEDLTEEQANAAVERYFSRLYVFEAPEKSFLASLYVDRVRIGRKYGIPSVATISAGALLWGMVSFGKAVHRKSLERNTEASIELAYKQQRTLSKRARDISSSPFIEQLPENERAKLMASVSGSETRLRESDSFFDRFCSKGTADDDVTQENYAEAGNQLSIVKSSLKSADSMVKSGESIIDTQKTIVSTKQTLDSLIGEIRNTKPLEAFTKRAEVLYENGIGCINNRQLTDAISYRKQLTDVRRDIERFSDLSGRVDGVYADIIAVAKEDSAKTKGEELYKEAKQFIQSVDVSRLSETVRELEDVDRTLNLEYTIRIINKEGEKSGIDRYYTDNRGRRVSGYYLIVEAIDRRGNALPMRIRNEEDGSTTTVTMWGERVPKSEYEEVKEDKLDDGIVDRDTVGEKKKGYLTERMIMIPKKEGQITDW